MAKSVYEMVTDRIIEQLESGIIPWEKPWTGIRSGAFNRISKKSYSLFTEKNFTYPLCLLSGAPITLIFFTL